VNCIAPGTIRTDRSQGTPEHDANVSAYAPLGRRGDQAEIAKAVIFLVSDLASYVTGHTLLVDGGVQTNCPFPLAR
jgi:NAD(P)-dependent dehydrogenase (short-subunit alcohol dehydrogenase family)